MLTSLGSDVYQVIIEYNLSYKGVGPTKWRETLAKTLYGNNKSTLPTLKGKFGLLSKMIVFGSLI